MLARRRADRLVHRNAHPSLYLPTTQWQVEGERHLAYEPPTGRTARAGARCHNRQSLLSRTPAIAAPSRRSGQRAKPGGEHPSGEGVT